MINFQIPEWGVFMAILAMIGLAIVIFEWGFGKGLKHNSYLLTGKRGVPAPNDPSTWTDYDVNGDSVYILDDHEYGVLYLAIGYAGQPRRRFCRAHEVSGVLPSYSLRKKMLNMFNAEDE